MGVLLVDDEESFLKLCSKKLESEVNQKIHTISDPKRTLKEIEEKDIDCVVCDYDMPDLNGLEVCRMVKERFPGVVFILYTSYTDRDIVEGAFDAGADEYLNKGIGKSQYMVLAKRIENLINLGVSQEEEKENYLEEILKASRRMAEVRTKKEIADIAIQTMADTLDMPLSSIYILDEDENSFKPLSYAKEVRNVFDKIPELEKESSLAGEVFEEQECKFFEDLEKEEKTYNSDTPIKSEVILPLGDKGVMISGSLSKKAFSKTEIHGAELLASVTEASMNRAEREELLRKREKELEKQNERLNQFASILSHDLRSPLNLAQGYLELAIDSKDEEDLKEIQQAHERIENIIESMLTLANHTEEVEETEVSLKEIAESSWKFADPGLGDKLKIQDDVILETDPEKLKHILENLFSNSIEHSDINVTVRIGALENGFYVEDDGPGIPEEKRKKALEFGYSDDGGTGFGLSIVEQISSFLGFEMDIKRSKKGGARFEFRRRRGLDQ